MSVNKIEWRLDEETNVWEGIIKVEKVIVRHYADSGKVYFPSTEHIDHSMLEQITNGINNLIDNVSDIKIEEKK